MTEKEFIRIKKHHLIKYKKPNIQSLSSLILLKKNLFKKENPHSHWRYWIFFRNTFLRKMKKIDKLICIYCGTKNLKIEHKKGIPKKQRATIDHIIPLSKGGKKFDIENLVVSCYTCNNKKGDNLDSYE